MEEALPSGIVEKRVPQDLVEVFAGDIGHDVGWIRCFTCDQDWDKLNQQMAHNLAKLEYRDVTSVYLEDFIADTEIPREHAVKMLKVYSQPGRQGVVLDMNLAYTRTISSKPFDTAGDYLVITGYSL